MRRCLRHRRAIRGGSWIPPGLGSSLKLWLTPGTQYYGLGGGGDIASWHDRSGNGNDATQGTTGNQPTPESDGFSVGRPTVRFVGANTDFLIQEAIGALATGADTAYTIARVFQNVSGVGTEWGFGNSASANAQVQWQSPHAGGGGKFRHFRRDDTGGAGASNTQDDSSTSNVGSSMQRLITVFRGTSVSLYINGTADGTMSAAGAAADVGSLTLNRFTIGAGRLNAGAINPLDCRLGPFLFWNGALSDAEIASVDAGLMNW